MTKTQRFNQACLEIRNRDVELKRTYILRGKGRDKALALKGIYANIASKTLAYEIVSKRYIFSWQQVTDACKLADLYVTEVVSSNL